MAKNSSKNQPAPEPEPQEQLSESYISIGLGLLVVIVVGVLLYNYFTQKKTTGETPTENTAEITEEATMAAKPGGNYTVQAGDTLWSIAEKSYQNGFEWKRIADANNIQNNDQLVAGQTLKIPELTAAASTNPAASDVAMVASAAPVATVAPVATPVASPVALQPSPAVVASPTPTVTTPPATQGAAISGASYTVASGDTLWDIACRAYNDCYAWSKIAAANKITNPDLIYAGSVFSIPR